MAVTVARLQAVLSADTKQFTAAMAKSELQMKSVAKAARFAGVGILAGLGVTAAIGFKELQRGAEATAQTNAVSSPRAASPTSRASTFSSLPLP